MAIYKSVFPPVCVFGPHSKKWYVIADGIWHQVSRNIPWQELEKMWEKITYSTSAKPTKQKEIKKYFVDGSKGNKYEVVNDDGFWTCSCPAHGFGRGKDCKHITLIKSQNK
jgi:hypothetical protein